MSLSLRNVTSYALHFGKARGRYSIHSPFVYDLLVGTIKDKSIRSGYEKIEERIGELEKDKREIQVKELGAGSKWTSDRKRKVEQMARRTGCDRKFGRLLFRLAERFASGHALELGTSLGMGTMYLSGGSGGTVHSIEGCTSSAAIAQEMLGKIGMMNPKLYEGAFQEKLPEVLKEMPCVDLVRIDGDHRGDALLNYFEQCLAKAHNDTLFVLDDIHWSTDMENAWEAIKQDPRVTLTIDLYKASLLFIRKEQREPLHFRIRF